MSRKCIWWCAVGLLLLLMAGSIVLWLLIPARIDEQIHLGMTRAEVEAITGEGGEITMRGSSISEDPRYYIYGYQGDWLLVVYRRNAVEQVMFFRPSFWERVQSIFGWRNP